MSKALLVDTNRAAYTIYEHLVSLGHEVWVVGGNPHEPLAKICPNFVNLDYSDVDALDRFVTAESFDLLVPGCTDVSYKACAEVNRGRYRGIDSPASTRSLNDKSEFRRVATDVEIPVPRVLDLADSVEFESVIVKPVDSFSGRGISILTRPSPDQVQNAYEQACGASKAGTALVEEYVDGQLYSHSAFVSGGSVVADFVVREDCTTNPFTVDTSYVDYDFDAEVLQALRADILRLSAHLGLEDGLIHSQFILGNGRYWVIELTRRCPGDLYAMLIEMSTGYPYGAGYCGPFIGEKAPNRNAEHVGEQRNWIIRHTATSKDGEPLWGFNFTHGVEMKFFVPLAVAGDSIEPSPYGRAAVFFLAADSQARRQSLYQELLDRNLYHYDLDSD